MASVSSELLCRVGLVLQIVCVSCATSCQQLFVIQTVVKLGLHLTSVPVASAFVSDTCCGGTQNNQKIVKNTSQA